MSVQSRFRELNMKIAVIGATGHIGSSLVPALIRRGHTVVAISRNQKRPYNEGREWKCAEQIFAERRTFLQNAPLLKKYAFDAVIDTLSMNAADAEMLVDAFAGTGAHLIVIGTIWIYREKYSIPVREEHPATEYEEYGAEKARMVRTLSEYAREKGYRWTVLHPGHISGKGWLPINPQGNLNEAVYRDIAAGREIILPFLGLTTLQFVHAQDLAELCIACLKQPEKSDRQVFHATCADAIPLQSYANRLYEHFGKTPALSFVSLEEFRRRLSPEDYACSMDHITHSPCCSTEKAKNLLGFVPSHSCLQTVLDAISDRF